MVVDYPVWNPGGPVAGQPLLVCVKDEPTRRAFAEVLGNRKYTMLVCPSPDSCAAQVRKTSPSGLLLDLSLHPSMGLTSLKLIRDSGNDVPAVVVCAAGDTATARAAFALDASDAVYLPLDESAIVETVERALTARRLLAEVQLRRQLSMACLEDFVGDSATLDSLKHQMNRLREVDVTEVLITGESGTGKDVVAHQLHARGPRQDRPFLELDCTGITDEAFLHEFLGEEVSSLTPARTPGVFSRGLLELADGGVVVLDRISELSLSAQAVVESCLANGTLRRRNGRSDIPFSAAIYATTTRDLRAEVEAGRFRKDLYLRLGATSLHLPPLRERSSDIPILVHHFLTQASARHGVKRQNVSSQALELLRRYPWPGNVRELRNLVERLVILRPSVTLQPEHLPAEVRQQLPESLVDVMTGCPFVLPPTGVELDLVERGLISQALNRTRGNQSAAARLLGISRYALRYRMEKHDLTG